MQTFAHSFGEVIEPYKISIEKMLRNCIEELGPKNSVRDACEYALLNNGKRFRPALVLMVAKALGDVDVSQSALAIEFFHTASLIADDLPCMDDDAERRNRPTTHRVFGESTALLATYALISSGYACLAKNAAVIKEKYAHLSFANNADALCRAAVENVSFNTGLFGASGGQFLDLSPPDLTLPMLREIIHKKTVTLFEISFVLGWLFGGGSEERLPLVKKSSAHFGMAFQIIDDIDDMEQDLAHDHALNLANVSGKEKALSLFYEEIDSFRETLVALSLHDSDIYKLADILVFQAQSFDC